METKKFWCHYIGSDGNTPRRRNIELTKLTLQDVTLWAEPEDATSYSTYNVRYELYMQLSDNVAVTCNNSFSDRDWAEMQKTDQQFREEAEQRKVKFNWKDEDVEIYVSNGIKSRDYMIECFKKLANLTDYLLSDESNWVMLPQLAAYKEVNHPQYPALLAKRKACEELRRQRDLQRKEEERKRREEEERKRKEEEAAEAKRLSEEQEKFKNGESISGEDVVTLCRQHGISIHLRTVHNLQQVIYDINGLGDCRYHRQRGKRIPVLDGCYKTAKELYKYLNNQ